MEKRWRHAFKVSICWIAKPRVSMEGVAEQEEVQEGNLQRALPT